MSSNDSGKIAGGSGAGAGRGKLLSMLRAAHSSSAEESSESGYKTNPKPTESTSSPIGVGCGRGKLLASLTDTAKSTTSDETKSGVEVGSRRSKFFSALGTPAPDVGLQAQAASVAMSHLQIQRDLTIAGTSSSIEEKRLPCNSPPTVEQPENDDDNETEKETCQRVGSSGVAVNAMSNFIRLKIESDKGVYEYEVRFEPNIHASTVRYQLLNQHLGIIGKTKSFDGVTLFLPILLADRVTVLKSINENDKSTVTVSIIYKRKKRFVDCKQLYGMLFDRIMKILKFVRFGQKNFDPTEPKVVPQHKLEVWPGYVTAVDEYKDGVMLCVDITHRVLCQETVLEKMMHAYHSARGNHEDFKKKILTALLGSIVLTRYNNKTYRIDDIDFDANPTNTFRTKDKEVTYVEYYKSQYGIEIRDLKQPLLMHRKDVTIAGKQEKQSLVFCIVPEISYLTGLTDEMREDFKVMRDIATFTKITPNQRVQALEQYCKRVNATPATKEILGNWGLTLDEKGINLQIRQLGEEKIFFANNKSFSAGRNADFGKFATNNELLHVINLTNWIVMHSRNDNRSAKAFVECMERNSRPMGIMVAAPNVIPLNDDKTETYVNALRNSLSAQTQIVVCICPTSRDDRYAAIKKVCCAEIPIPSQVINSRTLSNETKNRSIVQKIALQMNCKLGGTLWSIKIPFENVMIIGIDTYHEAKQKTNSVSAFVASINNTFTRWYSKAVIQSRNEELVHGLVNSLEKALRVYKEVNNKLPQRVIIFRDGVGDGQLKLCKEYELPQLIDGCKLIEPDYKPTFTFIVVQKRVNTRIYAQNNNNYENPNPGCILDHTITRRHLYDFYLVPQSVRQGTVTPTHFVVVEDEANFPPDVLQRLSYKLCFLYYNWPGTVRVPACCQYAHKLAYLVGQSIKRETSEKLADKLFYL